MLDHSLPTYLFIRLSILALRAITPLSITYTLYTLSTLLLRDDNSRALQPPSHPILLLYTTLESAFYLLVYLPRKHWVLQQPPTRDPTTARRTREQRRALFARCLATAGDLDEYLRGWFLGAPAAEIKRDNVREFIAWGFFDDDEHNGVGDEDDDPADREAELDLFVSQLEAKRGAPLPPGRGKATCLRLTLDAVGMRHRPLFWYALVGFVDTITALDLRRHGFHLYRPTGSWSRSWWRNFPWRLPELLTTHQAPPGAGPLSYWHRPARSPSPHRRLPVLFLHGIGIGLHPYRNFLSALAAEDDTEILALELMPISARLTTPIPPRAALCRHIRAVLAHHRWDRFVVVANSYGTVVAAHLLRDQGEQGESDEPGDDGGHPLAPRIAAALLIDPVTFLLHRPTVAVHFTRRLPRAAPEWQVWYFAATDPGVAHCLGRCFFWAENQLWREEVDCESRKVTVCLAERDCILDAQAVGGYLAAGDGEWKRRPWTGEGSLEVTWLPGLDHAQVFERRAGVERLVGVVRVYSLRGVVEEEGG